MDETRKREAAWILNGWKYLMDHPDEEQWLDPWLARLETYAATYGMEETVEECFRGIAEWAAGRVAARRQHARDPALPESDPRHPGPLARPAFAGYRPPATRRAPRHQSEPRA